MATKYLLSYKQPFTYRCSLLSRSDVLSFCQASFPKAISSVSLVNGFLGHSLPSCGPRYLRGGAARRVLTQASGKRSPSSVSNSLIAVLKDEIKYERESYRKNELIIGEPPNGFDIEDEEGWTWFFLTKRFENELVVVRVDIQSNLDDEDDGGEDDDEDYEDESEQALPIQFLVTIGKDIDEGLAFECESDGEYLIINRVALRSKQDESEEIPPYSGPVFQDLDDTLQQAFVDYLEERGINANLGEYIRTYAEDKAKLEYQRWLGRVRDFIAR